MGPKNYLDNLQKGAQIQNENEVQIDKFIIKDLKDVKAADQQSESFLSQNE